MGLMSTATIVILIAVATRIILFREDPCGRENEGHTVRLSLAGPMISEREKMILVCGVFSQTYDEARSRFRKAVEDLRALKRFGSMTLDSLPVVVDEDGHQYTMDITVVPGNVAGLVIHSSGVHGVEGYAGSAVQVAFLQLIYLHYHQLDEASSNHSSEPLQYPTLIFVHAVNPFGMARFRRTNEHNVDLNRNGLHPDKWKTFTVNHYNRGNYERFDKTFFNPSRTPTWWSGTGEYFGTALVLAAQHGFGKIKAAMVGAQYHSPTGISYGGKDTVEPSLQLLQNWLDEYFMKQKNGQREEDLTSRKDVVTWIDLHTGLGANGVDTLLSFFVAEQMDNEKKEVDHWFPGAHHPLTSSSAASVAKGYEQVKGTIGDYFRPLFAPDQHAFIVTQEFGTIPAVLVGRALVLENAAFHHLPADEALEWAKRTTKLAFYPQSSAWREKVLIRGTRLLMQAMDRSKALSM
jgi:hypothetical protein